MRVRLRFSGGGARLSMNSSIAASGARSGFTPAARMVRSTVRGSAAQVCSEASAALSSGVRCRRFGRAASFASSRSSSASPRGSDGGRAGLQLPDVALGERREPRVERARLSLAPARALGTVSVARSTKSGRVQPWSRVQRQIRGAADAGPGLDLRVGQHVCLRPDLRTAATLASEYGRREPRLRGPTASRGGLVRPHIEARDRGVEGMGHP